MPFRPGHIVLVAGPSGAGKSTFIEMLQAQRLPLDIAQRLPRGAEAWPLVEADLRVARVSAALTSDALVGATLVVHYDMTLPSRCGVASYAEDPELSFLRGGCSVTIVNIVPSYAQLAAQFRERMRHRLARKHALRRLWRWYVWSPAGRLRLLCTRQVRATGDVFYATPEWLHNSRRQWNELIAGHIRDNPRSVVIDIEPCRDASGRPGFRLREAASRPRRLRPMLGTGAGRWLALWRRPAVH